MKPTNGKIEALWCIDSESGREFLIDLHTQEIIAERVNGKLIDPSSASIKENGGE